MKITAVSFSDGEATKLIRQKLSGTVAAWGCFLVCFTLGMSAAMLASARGHFDGTVIALTCCASFAACLLVAASAISIACTVKTHKMTRKKIAEAMYSGEEILCGGADMEFEVTFSEQVIKLCRKGYAFQISFDLSGLKKIPSVYSSFGEDLLEFMRGYYFKNGKTREYGDIKITDSVTDKSTVIYIIRDGKPTKDVSGGYYLKKGLIK